MKAPLTRRHRGFNLVESAIVLGIVGLVIGGIWAAVNAVQLNMFVNNTKTAVVQIVANSRALLKNMPIPPSSPRTNLTAELMAANVFPGGFKLTDGNNCWNEGPGAASPDKSSFEICVYGPSASVRTLQLSFAGFSKAECVRLVPLMQTLDPNMSIELADIYSYANSGLPMSPDTIDSECDYGMFRIDIPMP